jgi:hypothetical protein
MIIRGRRRDTEYTLSLKPDSLSVAINTALVIVYDRAGRFYSLYQDSYYRRSLSGQVLQKWQSADGRQRRWLAAADAEAVIDLAADQLRELLDALPAPDWQWLTPPDHPAQLRDFERVIERGARFDSAAARLDAARFNEVYSPIGILPPDQYLALVVQATDGCSFNTCTFCDLYQQPFRVKTPDEFRAHLRQVRAYLGESMLLRQHSIFLGAANALALPMARLAPLLEIIRDECHSERSEESLGQTGDAVGGPEISRFAAQKLAQGCHSERSEEFLGQTGDAVGGPEISRFAAQKLAQGCHSERSEESLGQTGDAVGGPEIPRFARNDTPAVRNDTPAVRNDTPAARNDTRGVYAFLDAFTGARKSVADYRALADLGLRRVYIGLESGHDPLLHFVKKPGRAADAIETVRSIKAAGLHVGVIVLIGLGGDRFVAGHTRDTIAVLNHMQLGDGDLIYFSDLVEAADTPYPRLAAQQGLRALSADERAAQRAAIRRSLNLNGVKISNYDIREFVY